MITVYGPPVTGGPCFIEATHGHRPLKTSDVLKLALTGREGEKLGSVREAFVDPVSGRIGFLIVEAPSLLGAGKFHPVPWTAVRFDEVDNAFKAPITKDAFKASPNYDRDQLADANYGWHEQAAKYFAGLSGYAASVQP